MFSKRKRHDIRSLITEEQYLSLLEDLKQDEQESFLEFIFFDTPKKNLLANNATLSLRCTDKRHYRLVLSVSTDEGWSENWSVSPLCDNERNRFLSSLQIPVQGLEMKEALSQFVNDQKIEIIGKVSVSRFLIENNQDGLIKLDKNFFHNGYTDYEVSFGVRESYEKTDNDFAFLCMETHNIILEYPGNRYQRMMSNHQITL